MQMIAQQRNMQSTVMASCHNFPLVFLPLRQLVNESKTPYGGKRRSAKVDYIRWV